MKLKITFHKNLAIIIFILMTGNFSFAQNIFYIKDSAIAAKPVSPLLYSSFLELGWGRSTDNMWAELLYNRSFEEDEARLGDYAGGGLIKDVKVSNENWWHSGYEAAKWYLRKDGTGNQSNMKIFDGTWPLPGNGKRCMELFNKSNDKDILFCQDSIYLHKNVSYHFEGLLNNLQEFTADSVTKKTITISICLFKEGDFSKPLSEKIIIVNTGYFHNYKAILPAFDYEGRGTFAIKIHAGNKLNVDLLSLMPADNIMGWRKDVVAAMRDSVPVGTIRFPGGCFASTYLWRDGIGDRQKRKMIFDALSDGGSDVVHDVGTVEFLNLCKLTKAVPVLDVAVMLNTAEYAADWVAFCNAPTNALRNSVSYTKPFNVKYWEMDNEPYRKFDAITYAHKCVEFSKAMKKVDPTIKLIMGNYFIYGPKLKVMLGIAGKYIDVINKREDLPFAEYKKTLDIITAYNKMHGTHITMCDTETTFPPQAESSNESVDGLNHQIEEDKTSNLNKAVRWAHGMSGIKNYIKFQNLGGDFIFANYWAYVNSYGENLLNVTKENVFVSAPGKAYRFMELTNLSVPVKVTSAPDKDVLVQAGWSKEKNKFIVIVLNFTDQTLTPNFDLTQLHVRSLKCNNSYSVFAKNIYDFNSPEHPDMIKSETSRTEINEMKFPLTAKPNSATYWEFTVVR